MLYQTLSLFYQLNPCSPSSLSPSPSSLPPPEQKHMDCLKEKALKTSFWAENTPQVLTEDVWVGNGGNNGVSGDDLFVDGLLDFSNVEDNEEEAGKDKGSCCLSQQHSNSSQEEVFIVKDEFGTVTPNELSVPVDELANLEWLSHFVEDSFSEFSLQHYPLDKTKIPNVNRSEPETETETETVTGTDVVKTGFLSSVPAKARSKRSRSGGRVWSLGSLPSTDSSSSYSSSSYSSSPSSSSSSSCLIYNRTGYEMFSYLGKPPKKPKRKPGVVSFSSWSEPHHHQYHQYYQKQQQSQQQQRRCSHCGVQKTPQWRTGPMGAKTLCNACGVRFKSGRLLPEYRPACSPTFSSEVHSNNHRKVLEMRRKKEMVDGPESEYRFNAFEV